MDGRHEDDAVGFKDALRSELSLCSGSERGGASLAAVAANFIASQACCGTHRLSSVVTASIELLRERKLLRQQLASALTGEALANQCSQRCLMAIAAFSEANIWNTDSLLQASRGPEQLAAALPQLLHSCMMQSCVGPTDSHSRQEPNSCDLTEKWAAFRNLLGDLIRTGFSAAASPTRSAAQVSLGLIRTSWADWELQEDCLSSLVDTLSTAAQHVQPVCIAHRFLLGELKGLLLPEQRPASRSASAWDWVHLPPPIMLGTALKVVVQSVGLSAMADALKLSILTGGVCWKVVFSAVHEVLWHSSSADGMVDSMLQEFTSEGIGRGCENNMRGALMLTRAVFSARSSRINGQPGALKKAVAEYEEWFTKALAHLSTAASRPAGSTSSGSSHRATQLLFRLLTELVPNDPFELLKCQRAACCGMAVRSVLVQDYVLLVQSRMKDLQLQHMDSLPTAAHGGDNAAAAVTPEDRREAERRTLEFVGNDYRIPPSFLNIIRNFKKSWFVEHLLPALMEPPGGSDTARDDRLKFLEALAAKHLAPNSAPMMFQRACETAASKADHCELPQDASLEDLCGLLPKLLVTAAPGGVAAAMERLGSQVDAELAADGSQANIASLTDSLLELPVACLRQGGSIAGIWHIYFARIIWQKEPIHERLWLRVMELCRDHSAALSSHQVYALAAILVSMATLSNGALKAHLCFTGFYADVGSINCAPSDTLPGPLLTREVLWVATLSLLLQGQLMPALRLACSYIMCALRLGLHVSCSVPELEVQHRPQAGTCPARASNLAIADLVAWVPQEIVHFLMWATRHASLRKGTLVEEWKTLHGDGRHPEDPFPFFEVVRTLMSSSAGAQLAETAGSLPIRTFLLLEVAMGSGGLAPAALTDISVRQYLWESSWREGPGSKLGRVEDITSRPDSTSTSTEGAATSLQGCLSELPLSILKYRCARDRCSTLCAMASAICLAGGVMQDWVAAKHSATLSIEGGHVMEWTVQAVSRMYCEMEAAGDSVPCPLANSLVQQVAVQLLLRPRLHLSRISDVQSWCCNVQHLLSSTPSATIEDKLMASLLLDHPPASAPTSPMES